MWKNCQINSVQGLVFEWEDSGEGDKQMDWFQHLQRCRRFSSLSWWRERWASMQNYWLTPELCFCALLKSLNVTQPLVSRVTCIPQLVGSGSWGFLAAAGWNRLQRRYCIRNLLLAALAYCHSCSFFMFVCKCSLTTCRVVVKFEKSATQIGNGEGFKVKVSWSSCPPLLAFLSISFCFLVCEYVCACVWNNNTIFSKGGLFFLSHPWSPIHQRVMNSPAGNCLNCLSLLTM